MPPHENLYAVEWSPPGYRKGIIRPGRGFAGVPTPPRPLCGATGTWNCCDLYLEAPSGWLPSIVTLHAEVDGIRVPIERKLLSEADYDEDTTNNTFVALVFSVRGHPATAWDVTIEPATTATGEGRFRFMCWGQDGAEETPRLTPRRYSSPGLDDVEVVSTRPVKLLQLFAVSNVRARRWLQLFDRDTVPPGGTTPDVAPIPIRNYGIGSYTFAGGGWRFETGLVWAVSTTLASYTATGSADLFVSALYRGP